MAIPSISRPARLQATALLALALATAPAVHAHPGSGIVLDRDGNVYFVDTGHGVWKLDAAGALTTHGGPAFHWMALDPAGAFAGARLPRTSHSEMRATGGEPNVVVSSDFPIAIGEDGALYYAEPDRDERLTLVGIRADGARRELARLPESGSRGKLRWVNGLAAGAGGSFLFTDDRAVYRVARDGAITTVARDLRVDGCAMPPGYRAELLPGLRGLAEGSDGTIWIAASGCAAVLRIAPGGGAAVALRAEPPWSPTAVAAGPGGVYVLEYLHTASEDDDRRLWIPRVRRLAADATVATLVTVERAAPPRR